MTPDLNLKPGSIVQADPEKTNWGPCLVVVAGVRKWGIQGYTDIPNQGTAYILLPWNQIEPTGGTVIWAPPGALLDGDKPAK